MHFLYFDCHQSIVDEFVNQECLEAITHDGVLSNQNETSDDNVHQKVI